eukprot:gnl/TRDRNA2_/TRDRNA2_135010_c0_seq1.p1 gnl/TRDRNA2_/TRDRNA2_135010_c0~~gnl/TRDRNA2_/TRDRNA2_135010_c0_seq1.p1  ORF type:complete len:228 (-),score=78.30 gnl/TRDRNA2_/TRDRNA2_135010_c0_seq1:143-826(-)
MPKVRRERTKYHDLAPPLVPPPRDAEDGDAEEDDDEEAEGEAKLSRGQKKRRERRESFMKKFEFVNYVQKQEQAKRDGIGLGDLGVLADGIDEVAREPETSRPTASTKRPQGRKGKKEADEREMAQYQQVLNFGAFQKDPLGTLEQHLRNSLKKQAEEPAVVAAVKAAKTKAAKMRKREGGKKRRKKSTAEVKKEEKARVALISKATTKGKEGIKGVKKNKLKKKNR